MRVQRESDRMVKDDSVTPTDSPQLEYVILRNKGIQVSKMTEPPTNSRQQHVENIGLAINNNTVDNNNVFNIQLNYNINQALDPESWDSNFHVISLYGSMEHLALDIKNIKKSLIRMRKYILGKFIDSNNANNIKDLEGIGMAV